MQLLSRKHRSTLGLVLIAGVGLLLFLVLVVDRVPRSVTIVDERFEVLACKLSCEKTHVMYDGHQLIERVNAFVKQLCGVNLTKHGGLEVRGFPSQAVMLRYRGRLDPRSLDDLEAVLVTDHGDPMQLQSIGRFKGADTFIKLFDASAVPTNPGPFLVTFRLRNGEEVAVWRGNRSK